MYLEADLLPLSALQHLAFCPRQCGLIHLERQWEENLFTAQGRVMHQKAHEEQTETRGGLRIVRGLPLRSLSLGLSGVADIVEFHNGEPFPVEYKRGRPKAGNCDQVQLCAQAICLEEMLKKSIAGGALFYGQTHRRLDVLFDDPLRQATKDLAQSLHQMMEQGRTPKAQPGPKCKSCSLVKVCLPETSGKEKVETYLKRQITRNMREA
ncbi:CRISPR-associated protein Cas4 [Dethiosulfatarculus sandiegensis]|uniref:CRISPR-associated exonuclease Cas4 n=1 Tax=Dethiosulfatarculus sandiegensis TaxID=1429043 RepID=A0A0D2G898_9BACT|nr:CRISPR-associated protein Cas4 [Dethiosulfatarculus sandiegensis]KIX11177.1 CRISPR-associated protein Cas4 [Dethiosulfatarculus sandiegensis]